MKSFWVFTTRICPVLNLLIISCNPQGLAFIKVKSNVILAGKSLKANVDPNFKLKSIEYISPEQKTGLNGFPIVTCHGVEGAPDKAETIPLIACSYF